MERYRVRYVLATLSLMLFYKAGENMKNKVSVKIEKVILPLHLEDNFELISCDDARLILQWRHSDKEVMIECSLEQLDSNRGLLHFDGDDFVHLNATITFSSFATNVDPSIVEDDEVFKSTIEKLNRGDYIAHCIGRCKLELDFI